MTCRDSNANGNSNRVDSLREPLSLVEAFIRRYSPLLNAHSNDFLTHELWKLIPSGLACDLEQVTDWHELPLKYLSLRQKYQSDPCERENSLATLKRDLIPTVDSHCFDNGSFNKSTQCVWHPNHDESLDMFLAAAVGCSLEALNVLTPPSVFSSHAVSSEVIPFVSHSMGVKKSHEIEKMSSFIAEICKKYDIPQVVDVGSGKGYLGTYLNLSYGLKVIELDSVQSNIEGSISRRSRLEARWDKLSGKAGHSESPEVKKLKLDNSDGGGPVISITRQVECADQLDRIMSSHLPEEAQRLSCVVTGLHTCGYLAMCAIDTFIKSTSSRAVVNVGCCYHLFDESHFVDTYVKHKTITTAPIFPMSKCLRESNKPVPFALGRNARMISAQSVDRLADQEAFHPHIFYRVLLQQLLKDHLGRTSNDWIVGKIGKKNVNMDFTAYVRKALSKLKLTSLSDKLSDDEISCYESRWSCMKEKFHLFYTLRCCLGPVVESCILLDRLCYLLEHAVVSDAYLIKVFDPVKSPRCYALFATKNESVAREKSEAPPSDEKV